MIDVSSIKTPNDYEAVFGRIVPRKESKPSISVTCEMCGTETKVFREGKRYCSASCRVAAHDAFKDPRLSRLNTVAEIAVFLNCSSTTVRNRIRSGTLHAHRVGNMLLVVRPLGVRTVAEITFPASIARKIVEFANDRGLSVREFAKASGLSSTTAQRVLTGGLLNHCFIKRKPLIKSNLIQFLVGRGEPVDTAEIAIESLLKD